MVERSIGIVGQVIPSVSTSTTWPLKKSARFLAWRSSPEDATGSAGAVSEMFDGGVCVGSCGFARGSGFVSGAGLGVVAAITGAGGGDVTDATGAGGCTTGLGGAAAGGGTAPLPGSNSS